jgi:hypothetical protein
MAVAKSLSRKGASRESSQNRARIPLESLEELGLSPTKEVKSERADTPPKKGGTIAKPETLLEKTETTLPADCILKEAGPSPPQDKEEENRADLPTGSRAVPPSPLREDPKEMIVLDQEEGKGAS